MIYVIMACASLEKGGETIESTFLEDSASNPQPEVDTEEDTDSGDTDTDTNTDTDTDTDTDIEDNVEDSTLDQVIFRATHNSYTGEDKGSLVEQLNSGVRFLELDVHDDNYSTLSSYQIGHGSVGEEVDINGENPNNFLLENWLSLINDWSQDQPTHSILTVALDIKDNLTNNESHETGNLSALNDAIITAFPSSLLLPSQWNGIPTVGESRGKIQVILSGELFTRGLYKRDRGENPAVAINDHGQVISVHDSGTGSLWYWTGQEQSNGEIEWIRHGRYDSGQNPSVALNNDGWIVEIHQSDSSGTLWSRLGYIDTDYEVIFFDSEYFDTGELPSIAFLDLNGYELREIHNSISTGNNWDWFLEIDQLNEEIEWGSHEQTSDAKFNTAISTSTRNTVEVWTASDQSAGSDTLLYGTNEIAQQRIRYAQIAHVEVQKLDPAELKDDETFFAAASSGSTSTIQTWNSEGLLTRMWAFQPSDIGTVLHYPATDEPLSDWYVSYMQSIGAVE